MKHTRRILNILLIAFLLSLTIVNVAFAQDNGSQGVLAPFGPILAAAVGIERVLQMIRNIVSPNPTEGPLARGSKALRYYTTIGGVILGLILVSLSDLRLLALADISTVPAIDFILTGVVIGLGSEFTHEVIKVVSEAKGRLRPNNQ